MSTGWRKGDPEIPLVWLSLMFLIRLKSYIDAYLISYGTNQR